MFFRAIKRIKGEFRPHFFVTNDWTEFLAVAALMEVQHAKSQKTALDGRCYHIQCPAGDTRDIFLTLGGRGAGGFSSTDGLSRCVRVL